MTKTIRKAVIKANSNKDNFLPLSNHFPVEFLKMGKKTILETLIDEVVELDVEEVIFLAPQNKRDLQLFFLNLPDQIDSLKKRGSPRAKRVEEIHSKVRDIKFSSVDKFSDLSNLNEEFAYLEAEKIIKSFNPLVDLMDIFKTSERPVIGLTEGAVGDLDLEKIAKNLFKIKGFTNQSKFLMTGRAIFTSRATSFFKDSINISDVIEKMTKRGHTGYGVRLSGDFFHIKDQDSYQKAVISHLPDQV